MCLLELSRAALRGLLLLLVLNVEPDVIHVRGCLARWFLVCMCVGARALALVSWLGVLLALAAVAVCVAVRRPSRFGLVSGHLFFESKAGVIELGVVAERIHSCVNGRRFNLDSRWLLACGLVEKGSVLSDQLGSAVTEMLNIVAGIVRNHVVWPIQTAQVLQKVALELDAVFARGAEPGRRLWILLPPLPFEGFVESLPCAR